MTSVVKPQEFYVASGSRRGWNRIRMTISVIFSVLLACLAVPVSSETSSPQTHGFDVVVVGGTPGGIMAAISVAREGHTAVLLERSSHVGGLPANGLGATDISTRDATGGLFMEFVTAVRKHYVETYGADSPQVKDCRQGYRFEPRVAEAIFARMFGEHEQKGLIVVRKRRQFDALPENLTKSDGRIASITVTERDSGLRECYEGKVFIDATYEGDLAAAAGAEYRLGREAQTEFNEPMAGRLYKTWSGPVGPGSTGLGDNAVQAYNYRLCLTRRAENRLLFEKPSDYRRDEYVSLIEDVRLGRMPGKHSHEMAYDGIGRLTNMATLPNDKTDGNNQHLAFLSTDLPEENWPWPTASWDWRDGYAERLRSYTLGLMWFVQNDSELPEGFRERCREWGMAQDEYTDNDGFPRQVYVREGRRIVGEYLFTAHDALPVQDKSRPPVHADSITASHYSLDSHAVRKRETGRVHLDGFFSYRTQPYTVPYGVIVPKGVDGLLTPVPVSGTHIGFSTLRMEPCWMAMGQAAGIAACLSIDAGTLPRKVDGLALQRALLAQGAVLIYFKDANPGDPSYEALQFFALRGFYRPEEWEAKLDEPVPDETARKWMAWTGVEKPQMYAAGKTTRGALLSALYDAVSKSLTKEEASRIRGRW